MNKDEWMKKWSGQQDLNLRPSGPKPDALARLRYAPMKVVLTLSKTEHFVKCSHTFFYIFLHGRLVQSQKPR